MTWRKANEYIAELGSSRPAKLASNSSAERGILRTTPMAWTSWSPWWLPGKKVQGRYCLPSRTCGLWNLEITMTARTVDVGRCEAYLRAC